MARDDKKPLVFNLPDGDKASVVTWAYVLEKFTEVITPVNTSLSLMNNDMVRISNKLDQLINKEE